MLREFLLNRARVLEGLGRGWESQPEVETRRGAAREALQAGRLLDCDRLLAEAEDIDAAAICEHGAMISRRRRSLVRTRSDRSALSRTRFLFAEAAEILMQAAHLAMEDVENLDLAADLLDQAAKDWFRAGDGGGQPSALERCAEVLSELDLLAEQQGWEARRADAKVALGRCHRAMGESRTDNGLLLIAENFLREALANPRLLTDPVKTAKAELELGNVLFVAGDRLKETRKLSQAQLLFESSLRVFSREDFPDQYAEANNSLGMCLRGVANKVSDEADSYRNLRRSARCHRKSLQVWTADRAPHDHAGARQNLAVALWLLGKGGKTFYVRAAIKHHLAAAEIWHPDAVPSWYAGNQFNLAIAYSILSELTKDTEYFEKAIDAYCAVQRVYTKVKNPLMWCNVQYSVARTLWAWSQAMPSVSLLNRAAGLLEEAAVLLPNDDANIYVRKVQELRFEVMAKLAEMSPT